MKHLVFGADAAGAASWPLSLRGNLDGLQQGEVSFAPTVDPNRTMPKLADLISAYPDAVILATCATCNKIGQIPCAALIVHGRGEWTLARAARFLRCRRKQACHGWASEVCIAIGERLITLPACSLEVDLHSI